MLAAWKIAFFLNSPIFSLNLPLWSLKISRFFLNLHIWGPAQGHLFVSENLGGHALVFFLNCHLDQNASLAIHLHEKEILIEKAPRDARIP